MKTISKFLFLFALIGLALPVGNLMAQDKPERPRGEHRMERGAMGMDRGLMRAVVPPRMVLRHKEQLALTDDQTRRIEGFVAQFESQTTDLRANLKQEASTLRELLQAPTVDGNAALAQADRVMALENQLKRARLEMMIQTKNALSAEQVENLQEFQKERRGKHRGQKGQRGQRRGR